MKILFLSTWYPFPPDNGSKIRIYNLLYGLAQEHDVTLITFRAQTNDKPGSTELAFCDRVISVVEKEYIPSSLKAMLGYLSIVPRSIKATYSAEMAECIRKTLTQDPYDLVIASQLGTACYSRYFRGLPALFEEVELGVPYERYKNSASFKGQIRNGITWFKQHNYISRLVQDFNVCTVVSEPEKRLLARIAPKYQNIEVVPNFVQVDEYREIERHTQPNTLIFTGSFRYAANHEAMVWFISEVYPLIRPHVQEVSLIITGDHANLALPQAENIRLTGYVDDVRSLIASATVSIVPLRTGGGSRLKILEAMAIGTPVVATSKGAEGLDAVDGQHLIVGDTAEEFADAVVSLLQNGGVRQRLANSAYQLVCEKYDWPVVLPRFLKLVQRVGQN